MAFQSIGDIADVSLGEPEVFEASWDTATDFSVSNKKYVEVSGDSVVLSSYDEGFEDGMDNWEVIRGASTSTEKQYNGSQSLNIGTWGIANSYPYTKRKVKDGGHKLETFIYYYNEINDDSTGQGIRLMNSSGNYEFGVASQNPEHDIDDANGYSQVYDPGENYDVWRKVKVTIDWTAGTFDVEWSEGDASPYYTVTDRPLKENKDIEYIEVWGTDGDSEPWHSEPEAGHFLDDVSVSPAPFGTLKTNTKVFSDAVKPGVSNLSYTLNGGNIQVSIRGSPGTAIEETNTFTLSAQTEQELDWDTAHDIFDVEVRMDTETSQSPVFSGLTLSREDVAQDISYEKTIVQGSSYQTSVTVTNNTATSETYDVSLTLNGGISTTDSLTQTTASLAEGQSETLTWTVDGDSPGDAFIRADLTGNTSGITESTQVDTRVYSASGTVTWETYDWANVAPSSDNYYEPTDGTVTTLDIDNSTTIKTETKSFPSQTQPDLVNLDYSPGDMEVDISVVGSPETPSEEIVTTTLVGNPAEELTWSSSHTDFRLELTFAGDNGDAPEITSLSLGTATSVTSVSWETAGDWDAGQKEFNMSHAADVLNATPAFRTEYSINTDGAGSNNSDFYHHFWTAQRTFWGDIRVTPMDGGSFNSSGAIEFGHPIDSGSTSKWDLREVVKKNGESTLTLEELEIEQGVEYYIGETYPSNYNNNGDFTPGNTDNGDVLGFYFHEHNTWYDWLSIGGKSDRSDSDSVFGFSKIEMKESYHLSGYKYSTSPIQPNLNDMDIDSNGDMVKISVIGSPNLPGEEIHLIDVVEDSTKEITWSSSHKKFQIGVHVLKSNTSISSIGLNPIAPPTGVTIDEERETEVDVSWSNPQSYDETRIYYSDTQSRDLSDYILSQTLTGSATSYTITGLSTWDEYYVLIMGVDSNGTVATSPYETAVPTPSNVVGWHSGVDWDSAQDEEGYGRNQKFKDLLKAEPELADYNQQHLEYWFPFDGDTRDYSGNNFHSSVCRPNVTFSEGKIGQAVEIVSAGNGNYIPINHFFNSSPAITAMTVSCWVYTQQRGDPAAEFPHTDIWSYDASEYVRLYVNDTSNGSNGKDGCGIYIKSASGGNAQINTGKFTDDGKWHHLVVTYDRYAVGDTTKLYFDGELEGQYDYARNEGLGSGSTRYGIMGKNTEGSSWNNTEQGDYELYEGKIDDFRFYRGYAFTEEEVSKIYQYGNEGVYHTTNIKTTPSDSQL